MQNARRIWKRYRLRRIAGHASKLCFCRYVLTWWLVCLMLFGIPVQIAMANPNPGSDVVPGAGNVIGTPLDWTGSSGLDAVINTATGNNIITWNNFDIGSNASVTFTQSDGWVLNNVQAADLMATGINGGLNAQNCGLIVVNPLGVVFGPDALVSARSFVASTLDVSTFNDDTLEFIKGDGIGEIDVMDGAQIQADALVALIAQKVLNAGTISCPGGSVLMAAGDRVLVCQTGSKVIVEMTSATGDIAGVGNVINEGEITANDGTIVLAAGDIYSIPLHPQLQIAELGEDPVVDDQPIRVETGSGSVQQLGTITADGPDGEVILTAGDEVVLGGTSITSSVDGEVITYAYDFRDRLATTYFNEGAEVSVGTGMAGINGNHILFEGTIDVLADGLVQVDPVTLTIADVIPAEGPEIDTFYREWIEAYSGSGVHLDLAADDMITVEYMTEGGGLIEGGAGNIQLRNVYDTGGIYFEREDEDAIEPVGPRTAIQTIGGGDIYMLAGKQGITTGDLTVGVASGNVTGNPGQILLFTNNDGDIETGAMLVRSGNDEVISAISSGNLIINGDLKAEGQEVSDAADKTISTKICLVADGFVEINGDVILYAHGKNNTRTDLHIDAQGTITVEGKIDAESNTSGSPTNGDGTLFAETIVRVHSAAQDEGDQEAVDIADGVDARAKIKGANFTASSSGDAGANVDIDDGHTEDDAIYDPVTGELVDGKHILIEIENNYDFSNCEDCPRPPGLPPIPALFWLADDAFDTGWRSGNIAGFDPEELDVLVNDNGIKFDASIIVDSLTTDKGGTLELVQFTDPDTQQTFWGIKYTPPTDQDFVWDGVSDYATFTDSFEYQATKEVDGETVLSVNTATVEIVVKNILPVLTDGSQEIQMNTDADFDLVSVFELPSVPLENTVYIVDEDGTPGSSPGTYGALTYGLVEGQIPVADGSIATDSGLIPDTLSMSGDTITYSPLDGYVSPPSEPTTFGYKATDSSIVDEQEIPVEQTGDLAVTVINELPTGDSYFGVVQMDSGDSKVDLDVDGFGGATVASETYSGTEYLSGPLGTYGGSLEYDGEWTYTPDGDLPGYVGDSVDTWSTNPAEYDLDVNPDEQFTVKLWNGQRTYYADGHSEVLSTDYGTGTVSLDITNVLPSGDSYFGVVQMDSGDSKAVLDVYGFGGATVASETYSGTEYLSGPLGTYGGELEYDGANYTYTPDTDLPGYVGDDVDTWSTNPAEYDLDVNPDEQFTVKLWNGQRTYTFNKETGEMSSSIEAGDYGSGTISLDITNTLPSGDSYFGVVHMDSGDTKTTLDYDGFGGATVASGTYSGAEYLTGPGAYGGELEYDGANYAYTPDTDLPGYVGDGVDTWSTNPAEYDLDVNPDEQFTVELWNGQRTYTFNKETGEMSSSIEAGDYGSGTISLDITNTLPTASGDLGQTPQGTILVVPQIDTTSPVLVLDPEPDNLSIVPGTYTSPSGSTLEFDGTQWIYTPAPGHTGPETFVVQAWDGQNNYEFVQGDGWTAIATPEYGEGTVSVEVTELTLLPAAPLPDLQIPELEGCPVLLDAAAAELGIGTEGLQIAMGNALALNPNIQPCNACARLLNAATMLADANSANVAALAMVIDEFIPADLPPTEEQMASIAVAFAEHANDDTHYAAAGEWVDALVAYVEVLTDDLGWSTPDAVAQMEKYLGPMSEGDYAAVAAYAAMLLAGLGG